MESAASIKLRNKIKNFTILFIVGLVLSGLTAFPIETQLAFGAKHISSFPPVLQAWFLQVYEAVRTTNQAYPYLAYGTDWLAFAHLVIAVVFYGPLKDPVRNKWVYQFGMIACMMVFPLAFICGPIRGIPFYWTLIDCSFGVFGFIPLYLCYKWTTELEILTTKQSSSD